MPSWNKWYITAFIYLVRIFIYICQNVVVCESISSVVLLFNNVEGQIFYQRNHILSRLFLFLNFLTVLRLYCSIVSESSGDEKKNHTVLFSLSFFITKANVIKIFICLSYKCRSKISRRLRERRWHHKKYRWRWRNRIEISPRRRKWCTQIWPK